MFFLLNAILKLKHSPVLITRVEYLKEAKRRKIFMANQCPM